MPSDASFATETGIFQVSLVVDARTLYRLCNANPGTFSSRLKKWLETSVAGPKTLQMGLRITKTSKPSASPPGRKKGKR